MLLLFDADNSNRFFTCAAPKLWNVSSFRIRNAESVVSPLKHELCLKPFTLREFSLFDTGPCSVYFYFYFHFFSFSVYFKVT